MTLLVEKLHFNGIALTFIQLSEKALESKVTMFVLIIKVC